MMPALPSLPELFPGVDPFGDVLDYVLFLLSSPTFRVLIGLTIGVAVLLAIAGYVVSLFLRSLNPGVTVGGERFTMNDARMVSELVSRVQRASSVVRKDGE